MAENLTEAGSFSLYFSGSGASLSTPHLYISALATWPRKLGPCGGWKGHFPGIPGFTNASLGGTLLITLHVDSPVNAVAVSPDGKQIIACSDSSVRVLDASTGDGVKELKGHTNQVESVAFSRDGRRIVSGSSDHLVLVWDASTGDQLKELNGHTQDVTSVVFSPDGKYIVSGSYDNSVLVWDASTGDQLKELEGHANCVTSVAFSPDGKYIVSGSYDHSVRIWDALTGDELKELNSHTNFVTSVGFSPDGKHIVSGSYDKSVRVWDVSMVHELKELKGHTNPVTSVASSLPDGKHSVSGSVNNSCSSRYIRERIVDSNRHKQYTGWLLFPHNSNRCMFVPPEAQLPDASNILTIPPSARSYVDFTHATFGAQWAECYHS